jgi:hypothetical protein
MTVLRGFLIVILSGSAGGAIGALVGYILARVMPGYYRGVFGNAGNAPWFNPVEVAVGLGITQGMICGVVVGCVVVLAVAWYESRKRVDDVTLPSRPLAEPSQGIKQRPGR